MKIQKVLDPMGKLECMKCKKFFYVTSDTKYLVNSCPSECEETDLIAVDSVCEICKKRFLELRVRG